MKDIIDRESKDCNTIVLDHHECHDEPLYFLEDEGSLHMKNTRIAFFEELYKEIGKHEFYISNLGPYAYTTPHTYQAAYSGQLINYTAPKGMFSLIVENMGQLMGNNKLDYRMQTHASVDLAGLKALSKL